MNEVTKSLRQYSINTSFGKIHTLEKGSGQPVIFFHGWSVDGWATKKILEKLSSNFRVIAPTMPGAYPSFAWNKSVKPEQFQHALVEWYKALGVNNAIIIGHSLGGILAILLAHEIQQSLQRLVLIDTVGASTGRSSKEWATAWLKKRVYTYKKYKSDVTKLVDRGFIKNAVLRTKDLIHLASFARSVDVQHLASEIMTPTLILWGEDDHFTPPEIGKKLQNKFPSSSFMIVPGNHDWPIFEPQFLLEKLLD